MSNIFKVLSKRAARPRDYKSVPWRVLMHIAWRNFISKKLRSFLTVFGVIIGVSAIFFLLSFGLGVQSLVTNQVIGDKSLKSIDVMSPNSKIIKLDEPTVNKIRTYPHVERVGVQYSFPGIMSYDGGEQDTIVYGQNLDYQSLSNLVLVSGRLLKNNDSRAVLINSSAVKSLNIKDAKSAINQVITIDIPLERVEAKEKNISDKFTVVGVIESGAGSEIFMPSHLFDTAGVPIYSQVKVVVDDIANTANTRKQIESSGLQTTSLTDTLAEIDNIFKFFNLILIGFGSIGMIVAVLGMFNTLTISLLERTKEIGLMMALGARRKDMRKLFIFEAGLISFIGSVIGVIIAIIVGRIVNLYINIGAASRGVTQSFDLFATPLWAVVLIIVVTVVIGLAVVYFPARRAERINPIDALRRE